jgi:hypothetical protein
MSPKGKKKKSKKVICLLNGGQANSCPPPMDAHLPLCGEHITELNTKLRFTIDDFIRSNFMEKRDESLVFNQKTGSVYSLNVTGTFIFKRALAGKDFCTILADSCDVFVIDDIKEVILDYRQFLDELHNAGLIKAADEH